MVAYCQMIPTLSKLVSLTDERFQELWEIDENLMRAELHDAELGCPP